MNLSENIKKYRKEKGMTQEELANKCGLSKNGLWNYENNKREPNIDTLNKIAVALDVSVSDLLGENITNLNDMDKEGLDLLYGYPELSPLIELFKSRDYKILSENMDIVIEKDNKIIAKIPEEDFCKIGKQTLSFINEFTDFQIYKLLETYEFLS